MSIRRYVCALMAVLLTACGGDDDAGSNTCGPEGCSAACEQLRGDNCDVLEHDCRQRILDAVSCVRGTPAEMPSVRVLTEDEYRAELLGDDEGEDAGVDDEASSDVWSESLVLLGLVAPAETIQSASEDDLATGLGGYYQSATRSITLIDRGDPEDGDEAQALLAHELVHALQDQDVGLSEVFDRTGRTVDAAIARTCLTEGEAMLYGDLGVALLEGVQADPGYWDAYLDRRLKFARRQVVTSASPYAALWHLRYSVGMRYVVDAWLAGGNSEVQGLYWRPPVSTIHWMHGYQAVQAHEGQLVQPLACLDAARPEGFELADQTSMGPFVVFAFLGHLLVDDRIYPSEAAWQDALHWRQDSLSAFNDEAGQVAVSWRILFDSKQLAERVARDLSAVTSVELEVLVRDRELEVLATDAEEIVESWRSTDRDACPPPQE